MILRPPESPRTDTLFPSPTLFRSLLWRRLGEPLKLDLIISGIVRIERAFGERHRLAAETADRFELRDRAAEIACGRALQLVGGRSAREEGRDFLVEPFGDMRGIDTRLDVGLDQHDSRLLERRGARRDADRDRILPHEPLFARTD